MEDTRYILSYAHLVEITDYFRHANDSLKNNLKPTHDELNSTALS
jgi:hypothetical protein